MTSTPNVNSIHLFNRIKPTKRLCSIVGCKNGIVQGGLCVSHGAKRRKCQFPGCEKNSKSAGLCSKHGPPRKKCEHEGCSNVAVQGGKCKTHGASSKKCATPGCGKIAALNGMCRRHSIDARTEEGVLAVPPGVPPAAPSFPARNMSDYLQMAAAQSSLASGMFSQGWFLNPMNSMSSMSAMNSAAFADPTMLAPQHALGGYGGQFSSLYGGAGFGMGSMGYGMGSMNSGMGSMNSGMGSMNSGNTMFYGAAGPSYMPAGGDAGVAGHLAPAMEMRREPNAETESSNEW
ncbi:hypothetical protein ACHAW6_008018 [Cyclotella cf. meneghiniana]